MNSHNRWFIVDAHLDIAFGALAFGRDYSRAAHETRRLEAGGEAEKMNGACTVGLPDLLAGRVGLIFGTLFVAPSGPQGMPEGLSYSTPDEAYQQGMAQLDYYHAWAKRDSRIKVLGSKVDLEKVIGDWRLVSGDGANPQSPISNLPSIGLVPLMEGADPIREPKELAHWVERGLRVVGLSWSGTRYAGGSWQGGPLTELGRELLKEIARLGVILDVSHLAQEALPETLERFEGDFVIASHSNPQKLVPTPRHLPDDAIRKIAKKGGVMGVVLCNAFLNPEWGKGELTRKEDVTLNDVTRMIDYYCQLTGSAEHVGIGSDFDGGFGVQAIPSELDTSADLQKIGDALVKRGYTTQDVQKIMGENWIRILRAALNDAGTQD